MMRAAVAAHRARGRRAWLDSDVRIATWNLNSVLAWLPRLVEWLQQAAPDVVCLQETKVADAA